MNRLSYIIAFMITGAVLVGCRKDDIKKEPALKLDYYTESYGPAGIGVQPPSKVQYEYDASGNVSRSSVSSYNASSATYEQLRYMTFTYANSRVNKVEGFLSGASTPYVRDVYEYLTDGRVSKITEDNYAAALTSEANFAYSSDKSVKVSYTYSNGQGFEYEFSYAENNIQGDKTTRGAELCGNGSYTYDTMISPFHNLGYVDYQLVNLSTNNRLTENVNYISCSFPALVPQSYAYNYNGQGLPTVATTTYKHSQATSQKNFFYRAD
jgi:hypothetical protein